jgi:hypothetical protein
MLHDDRVFVRVDDRDADDAQGCGARCRPGWIWDTVKNQAALVAQVGPFRVVASEQWFWIVNGHWAAGGPARSVEDAQRAAILTLRRDLSESGHRVAGDAAAELLAEVDALERVTFDRRAARGREPR